MIPFDDIYDSLSNATGNGTGGSGIRSGSEGTRTFKIETVSGDIDLDD